MKNKANIIDAETTFEAYIGLSDLSSTGAWTTVTGEKVDIKWSREGPSNLKLKFFQHCATLSTAGTINDVPCNITYAFFCELPIEN